MRQGYFGIVIIFAVLFILAVFAVHGWGATTLLPNGEQCFQTATGPVSSGSINMYYPNTTTPKTTWQDSGQVVANTQPIQLDANGCAIIYGVGTYREQLWTGPVVGGVTTGNLVFDLPTTDTSAYNSTFWAGLAGGTPNALTLTDVGFNGTGGSVINFKAIADNTGSTTINPSSYGNIPVVINSNTGPVPLIGGEIVQNGVYSVIFDPIAADFVLLNSSSGSGGGTSGIPIGVEVSCTGFNPPANFVFEYGQAISRTTYASLLTQLTLAQAGSINNSNGIVTSLTTTEQLSVGMAVEGPGIQAATAILTVDSSTQVTLNKTPTLNQTSVLTFYAYGDGDGSTTFNVPDRRGTLLVGRDNMGNSVKGVLTSTYTTNSPDSLGAALLATNKVTGGGLSFKQANLPNVAWPVTDPGHAHTIPFNGAGNSGPSVQVSGLTVGTTITGTSTTGISVHSGGSGTAMSIVNPSYTTNMCLKVQ